MTPASPQPTKVLAVLDDSDTQVALKSAMTLADAHQAEIDALVCVEPPKDIAIIARLADRKSDEIVDEMKARALERARIRLAQMAPGRKIEPTVAVGKAYLNIIWHVAEMGCDFVVKAAEPLTGIRGFLHASNDQHLLRKCPCPVWLQIPTAAPVPQRVIAAVDLDAWDAAEPDTLEGLNTRVVEAACQLAHAPGAEVTVLHAWAALGEGLVWAFSGQGEPRETADAYVREIHSTRQAAMDRFLATLRSNPACRTHALQPMLRCGAPEKVIEEASHDLHADVVVMGTVARTGLSGVFIGNTAENIVNSLKCPVLAVKPDGFVSPLLAQ